MRPRHQVSLCAVSVIGIALLSHVGEWDLRHHSGKAPNFAPISVAAAASAPGPRLGSPAPLYGKTPIALEANQGQTDDHARFFDHGAASDGRLQSTAESFQIASAFATTPSEPSPGNVASAAARGSDSYGKLPISFEPNEGQTAPGVQYLAHGAGYSLFLTSGEVVLALRASLPDSRGLNHGLVHSASPPTTQRAAAVRMQLIGSNREAPALGLDPLPGKSNYFIGSDPAKWHTDIPTYARVRYHEVYSGIDLAYYGNQKGELEHDFLVAPGAHPGQISFTLDDGRGRISQHKGGLRLHTAAGDLEMKRPVAYQMINGRRNTVDVDYKTSRGNRVLFRLGKYDRHAALVIDPVLQYAAVFGGSTDDYMMSMAIDASQNVYVTGYTFSTDFPLANAYQSTWVQGPYPPTTAGFVSKINPSGTALVYSTYLGGSYTTPDAVTVDGSGHVYVAGGTTSGFPLKNAHQSTYGGGGGDAFLTVLSPAGNSLEWSTYLGGYQLDYINAMAVDALGNVYISGYSYGDFPAQRSLGTQGTKGVWVAKFNKSGVLQYSSMYENIGQSTAMAVDSTGAAYVVGYAVISGLSSPQIPSTPGAFRPTCPVSTSCAWAAKFNPSGDSLAYSTYLGANQPNVGGASAIALDSDLNAYIAGDTGPGLPVWSSGFQRTYGGGSSDAFVVKLNATGTNLIWSTYLGGNGTDYAYALAIDEHRTVYVGGLTCSSNFPLKAPIQNYTTPGGCGPFVTTLSSSLSSIPYYSTYLGNQTGPYPWPTIYGIAVDPRLNVYVGGVDFQTLQPTPGAFSTGSTSSGAKVFLAKLVIMDDLALALSASPVPVALGSDLTYTIGVTSKGPDFGVNVRVSDTLPSGTTFVGYDAGGGTCTGPPVGSTGTLNCRMAQLSKDATWNVKLTVRVNAAPGSKLSNTAATISNMQDFTPGNNSSTITTSVN